MAQGLAAVVEQKKKQEEAQKAASGETPPIAGLKAATPKPAPKPRTTPVKSQFATPPPAMPKDEVDALRIQEQERYEARRKAREAQK